MKTFLREYWGLLLFLTIFFGGMGWIVHAVAKSDREGEVEKQYCGNVIDKGYDSPSSGHKSHTDAQYWLVIIDDDIHRAVRIHVTPGCYYSLKLNDHTCFTLSAKDMQNYGNTTTWEHLK